MEADKFCKALEVALSPEVVAKARMIRDVCARQEGRVVACEEIVKVVRGGGVLGNGKVKA